MQVDRNVHRSQGGLGIGLTLVKQMVEMHDGSVEARNAGPGQGSEFIVRLPTVPAPSPLAQPPEGNGSAGNASPRRILVVDDNEDSANTRGPDAAVFRPPGPRRSRRAGGDRNRQRVPS